MVCGALGPNRGTTPEEPKTGDSVAPAEAVKGSDAVNRLDWPERATVARIVQLRRSGASLSGKRRRVVEIGAGKVAVILETARGERLPAHAPRRRQQFSRLHAESA